MTRSRSEEHRQWFWRRTAKVMSSYIYGSKMLPLSFNCRGENMDFDKELGRIAKQYENEGYTVTVHPKGDQVPPFAAGLQLDIIAMRGEEAVVVEVKPRRSALADDPQSTQI